MKRKLVQTADGSHTLFVPELNENYHSVHGAVQESQHVFIASGLLAHPNQTLSILEIGLGTGLNAFLSLCEAAKVGKKVYYESIEAYPLTMEEVASLNYLSVLDATDKEEDFLKIHSAPVNQSVSFGENFTLCKHIARIQELDFTAQFDVIYFDAFAPEKQEEMWTQEVFDLMYKALKPEGFLVTYCAKGVVKRTMRAAGFTVEGIPGPPGKREMIRAYKEKAQTR